jgi:sulfate transport system permease protein
LGATRVFTLRRVILPMLLPALLTGFALALARAVGEYGSVIFIAGNIPLVTRSRPFSSSSGSRSSTTTAPVAHRPRHARHLLRPLLLLINLIQVWSRRMNPRGPDP